MIPTKFFSKATSLGALMLMTAMLAACGCIPCGNDDSLPSTSSRSGRTYIQLAPIAPPPPLYEEEKPSTTRAEVWRPGYWSYNGSNYNWVSGELIARPSPTAVWSPDHWSQHTYGWGFVPGYWQ